MSVNDADRPASLSDYRPEIDGLRAIAVLTVIAFHLNPDWLQGGFLGVDVFFVISGYLITGIIAGQARAGRFSIVAFYERRARRLLPAMLAMLGIVLAVAAACIRPADLERIGGVGWTAATSWSNIWLHFTQDYWAPDVRTNPLVHTWSLSVEEQFYLVIAPLVAWSAIRRKALTGMLAAFLLLSLLWSAFASMQHPDAAYYELPSRAWELLLGGALAVAPLPAMSARARAILGAAGLLAILLSVALVSEKTLFPVWGAIPVCLGTAAAIAAGGDGPAARLLSLPPLTWIGRISYSLYLWHWPIIVIAGYFALSPLGTWHLLALLPVIGLAGWASWRWVEQPFRAVKPGRRRIFFTGCAVSLLLVATAAFSCWWTEGWPQRVPASSRGLLKVERALHAFPSHGYTQPADVAANRVDILGPPSVTPSFVWWGDSHSLALANLVHPAALAHNVSGVRFGRPGAPPLLNLDVDRYGDFLDWNRAILAYITRHPELRTVFLCARWDRTASLATASPDPARSGKTGQEGMRIALEDTIAALHAIDRRIVVVAQVPRLQRPPVDHLSRSMWNPVIVEPTLRREDYDKELAAFRARVADAAARCGAAVTVIDVGFDLFGADGHLRLIDAGRLTYFDSKHIGAQGLRIVAPAFAKAMESTGVWRAARLPVPQPAP